MCDKDGYIVIVGKRAYGTFKTRARAKAWGLNQQDEAWYGDGVLGFKTHKTPFKIMEIDATWGEI